MYCCSASVSPSTLSSLSRHKKLMVFAGHLFTFRRLECMYFPLLVSLIHPRQPQNCKVLLVIVITIIKAIECVSSAIKHLAVTWPVLLDINEFIAPDLIQTLRFFASRPSDDFHSWLASIEAMQVQYSRDKCTVLALLVANFRVRRRIGALGRLKIAASGMNESEAQRTIQLWPRCSRLDTGLQSQNPKTRWANYRSHPCRDQDLVQVSLHLRERHKVHYITMGMYSGTTRTSLMSYFLSTRCDSLDLVKLASKLRFWSLKDTTVQTGVLKKPKPRTMMARIFPNGLLTPAGSRVHPHEFMLRESFPLSQNNTKRTNTGHVIPKMTAIMSKGRNTAATEWHWNGNYH